MAWIVRNAEARDETATIALWREAGLVAPHNDPAVDFRFALAGACAEILLLDIEDGSIGGSVMVGHDGHRGWVYYLASSPRLRRLGIGRRLVAAAEHWLAARGVLKLQLMIRPDNADVAMFYKKVGFEVTPRIVMAKWLEPAP